MSAPSAITVFKYLLGSFYFLVGTSSMALFIRDFISVRGYNGTKPNWKQRCRITTRKLFFFVVFLHQYVRTIYFFVPVSGYNDLQLKVPRWVALQNFLDFIPEALFFYTYSLLIIGWVNVFHKSHNIDNPKIQKCFAISLPIIGGLVVTSITTIALIVMTVCITQLDLEYKTAKQAQGILLSTLTGLATILFLVYYLLLFIRIRRSKYRTLIQDQMKRGMKRLQFMTLIYLIFLTLHALYILLMNDVFSKMRKDGLLNNNGYAVLWAGYFLFAEELPVIMILVGISIPNRMVVGKETIVELAEDPIEEIPDHIQGTDGEEEYSLYPEESVIPRL